MRKPVLFFLFLVSLSSPNVYAQVAKIIDVRGSVLVKEVPSSSWQKARVNMYLGNKAEVKTAKESMCILAFDEELRNTLTIKDNSHIKLEDIKPGKVFLRRGRVFLLIDDLAKIENFQVRTPTAVAGVRGTGDSVEFNRNETIVKCFEGKVNVQGLDKNGNPISDQDLYGGSGVEIGPAGEMGEVFGLDRSDFNEWDGFRSELENIRFDVESEKETKGQKHFLGKPRLAEQRDFRGEILDKRITDNKLLDNNLLADRTPEDLRLDEREELGQDFIDEHFDESFIGDRNIEDFKQEQRAEIRDETFLENRLERGDRWPPWN